MKTILSAICFLLISLPAFGQDTGYWVAQAERDLFTDELTLTLSLPCDNYIAIQNGNAPEGTPWGVLQIVYGGGSGGREGKSGIVFGWTELLADGNARFRFDGGPVEHVQLAYSDSPGERVSLQMLDPQEDVKEAVELFLNHETFVFGFNLPSGLQGHTTFALAGLDEAIDPYLAEMGMADLREADSGRNSSNGSGCFLQTLKPLQ